MRNSRGFTLMELLIAVLVLSIAATGALATWGFSSRVPASKRVTEMGVYIATEELERLKAQHYISLEDTLENAPRIHWYDRYGAWLGASATTGDYKAKVWVRPLVNRNNRADTEDLRELEVQVWNTDETQHYETARTLLSYGGV